MKKIGVNGPKFRGRYDSFLCPYEDKDSVLSDFLEREEAEGGPLPIEFNVLMMDDYERDDFCKKWGVEYL